MTEDPEKCAGLRQNHKPQNGVLIADCHWHQVMKDFEEIRTIDGMNLLVLACASLTLYFYVFHPHPNVRKLFGSKNNLIYRGYDFLNYFLVIMQIRNILSFFAQDFYFRGFFKNVLPNECDTFAICDSPIYLFQLILLCFLCVDRLIVAKFAKEGWPHNKNFYYVYIMMAMLFTLVYMTPIFLGIEKFDYEMTCNRCGFAIDWINQDRALYFLGLIFMLRNVIPVLVTVLSISAAIIIEWKIDNGSVKRQAERHLTTIIALITFVHYGVTLPIGIIRAIMRFSRLFYDGISVWDSPNLIRWALWLEASSPLVTMFARVAADSMTHILVFSLGEEEKKHDITTVVVSVPVPMTEKPKQETA